ncbi:cytochrome P450 [Nocardia sp. NPDC059239]|uniref:cytochrome P450 n=1 Tax=unclassified Nocardia TaxID=2637762 RepID=UPI0036BD01D6
MTKLDEVPSHVPTDLVVDLDFYALPSSEDDPQLAWRVFSELGRGPFVYSPYHGGYWVATNAADVMQFQRDNKNFSSHSITLPEREGPRMIPLEADPPNHGVYRRNIIPLMSAKALKELEPGIRALTVELVDGLHPQGGCDFISDFALKLPIIVFLQLMGLPIEDGERLNHYVDLFARDPDPGVKHEASVDMATYIAGWLQQRIAEPKDDGITSITRATIDGQPYTFDEMVSTGTLLALAGLDSVAMHISFIAQYLARNPGQRHYVTAHLDNLGPIVAEFARRFPIANLMRKLANDFEHSGVTMKAGDMVLISASTYNFDGDLFPNPGEIDFTRPSGKPHLTFGTGPHACPGSGLARLEVEIFLQEWLRRIPDFHIHPDVPLRMHASATNAVDQLSLQWATA